MKKHLWLKISLVLISTMIFLGIVLWGLDPEEVSVALQNTSWIWVIPMALSYGVGHLLRSWRLQILVGDVSYVRALTINSIGFLAINVIPMRLGEMVRPYMLVEREGISLARAIAAVVMERLLDVLMLLVMLLGLTVVIELPQEGVLINGIDIIATGQHMSGILLVGGVIGGGLMVWLGEPAIALLERLPLGAKLSGFARTFRDALLELVRDPRRGLGLVLLSAVIWSTTIAGVSCIMASFPGIPVGFAESWTVWTITLTGMTVAPTPGFFGAFELACSAALWLLNVDTDTARMFALVLHLTQFLFTCILGAAFLMYEGLSLRALIRPAGSMTQS